MHPLASPAITDAAGAVSSGQIDLAWTGSSDTVGVQGYKLYRGGAYARYAYDRAHPV